MAVSRPQFEFGIANGRQNEKNRIMRFVALYLYIYKSRHEKTCFCICAKAKVTAQLISAFVFATKMVQCLFFLNPKFQACYSLTCSFKKILQAVPNRRLLLFAFIYKCSINQPFKRYLLPTEYCRNNLNKHGVN